MIRPLTPQDAKTCFDLLKPHQSQPELWSWSPSDITSGIEHSRGFGLFVADSLVAFLLGRDWIGNSFKRDFDLDLALTGQAHQGQGYMKELFSAALSLFPGAWTLEVHPANKKAYTFYRSQGFTRLSRRPGYYSDGSFAWVMQRKA